MCITTVISFWCGLFLASDCKLSSETCDPFTFKWSNYFSDINGLCGSFVILLCNIHSLIMNFIKVFIRISRQGQSIPKFSRRLHTNCVLWIVYNNAGITSSSVYSLSAIKAPVCQGKSKIEAMKRNLSVMSFAV